MPLPIPDIMQAAALALVAAKRVVDERKSDAEEGIVALREALEKISPDDLLAVLNEVGMVYTGVNNMQILQFGSAPNLKNRSLDVAVVVNFGLGPRQFVTPIPPEAAEDILKTFGENYRMAKGQSTNGKLITDISEV